MTYKYLMDVSVPTGRLPIRNNRNTKKTIPKRFLNYPDRTIYSLHPLLRNRSLHKVMVALRDQLAKAIRVFYPLFWVAPKKAEDPI